MSESAWSASLVSPRPESPCSLKHEIINTITKPRMTVISRTHTTPDVELAANIAARVRSAIQINFLLCTFEAGMILIDSPSTASRLPDKRLKAIGSFFYKKQEINLYIRSCPGLVPETTLGIARPNREMLRESTRSTVIILRGRRYIARFRYDNLPHAHWRLAA